MKVTTREIYPNNEEIFKARDLYYTAFPPEERVEDDHMVALIKEGRASLLAIDAHPEHEDPICAGYAYLIRGKGAAGYLLFFAIYESLRGKGIGGAFLRWLGNAGICEQVVLDIEDPKVETAPNLEERISRKQFYLDRGFYETSLRLLYEGEYYEVLCTERELDIEGFMEILEDLRRLGSVITLA